MPRSRSTCRCCCFFCCLPLSLPLPCPCFLLCSRRCLLVVTLRRRRRICFCLCLCHCLARNKKPRVPHPSQSHREGWDVNHPPATKPLPLPLPLSLLFPLFSPLSFSCHPSPQAEDLLLPLSLPLRGAGAQAERPKGEAADFIAFIFAIYFLLHF